MTGQRIEVEAVILDLDDTLIREHDYVLSGYAAVAEALSPVLSVPGTQLLGRLTEIYEGPDRSRAFNALLDPFDRPDLVSTCVKTYRNHQPQICLTPSADALLTQLLARVPVGVVTDGPLVMQEAKVAALRLRERGVEVVCTDSLGGQAMWKPSPAGLIAVLDKLGVDPGHSAYIADNPHKDFIATARAGVRSLRLRQAGQLHARCEPTPGDPSPEREVSDLSEVLAQLALPEPNRSSAVNRE